MTITPGDLDVWVGLYVGKEEHFADVLNADGDRLFDLPMNDQSDL